MIYKTFFLVTILFLFTACDESSSQNTGDIQPVTLEEQIQNNFEENEKQWKRVQSKGKSCSIRSSKTGDAFYCVRKRCEEAGGAFDSSKLFCQCPMGLSFNAKGEGACLPPVPESEALEMSENYNAIPNFHVWLGKGNYKSWQDLIRSYQFDFGHLNLPYTISKPHVKKMIEYKDLDGLEDRDFFVNLENDLLPEDTGLAAEGTTNLEIIYETKQIAAYFNKPEVKRLGRDLSRKSFQSYYDLINQFQFPGDQKIEIRHRFFDNQGCAYICYRDEVLSLIQGNFAIKRRVFVDGLNVTEMIYLNDSPSVESPEVILYLDRSGDLNLVYELFYRNLNQAAIHIEADIYDRVGNILRSKARIFGNEAWVSRFEEPIYNENLAGPSMVSVCEFGRFPSPHNKDLSSRFVFGPYRAKENFEGSIWGWHKNELRSPELYVDGAIYFRKAGFADEMLRQESSQHHVLVMQEILKSSSLSTVTSMNYNSCFSLDPKRNPLLSESFPGKVVNMSMSIDEKESRCTVKQESLIKQTSNRLLWVFSAGNETQTDCKGRLSKHSNVLNVAAISYGGLHFNSKKISTFVSGNQSSSLAAGSISGMAAEIATRYPELSPRQLRKALLLGVDFRAANSISGGLTSLDKSLKIAGLINEEPKATNQYLLERLYLEDEQGRSLEEAEKTRKELLLLVKETKEDIESLVDALDEQDLSDSEYQLAYQDLTQSEEYMGLEKLLSNHRKALSDIEVVISKIEAEKSKLRSHLRWVNRKGAEI